MQVPFVKNVKVTVPVGVKLPVGVTVALSWTVDPAATAVTAVCTSSLWISVTMLVGFGQVLNGIKAKSFTVEVNDADVRVCGMKVLMQPVNPMDARLTLPSINSFVSMFATLFPLPSRHTQPPQGTVPPEFVTALTASVNPAPPPGSAELLIGGQGVDPGSATQAISW